MAAAAMSRWPAIVHRLASPTPALTKRTAFTKRRRIAMSRSFPTLKTTAK